MYILYTKGMKIVGHRGARGLAPENTIASLQKALQYKVEEIEFDLRATKDNVVVLHHNSFLRDPSGHRLRIRSATYAELKQHKPDLPTFEQVLDVVGQKTPLYIEVKPAVPTEPITKIIKACLNKGWPTSNLILASKSQKTLTALHLALPTLKTIVIEPWSGVRATYRARQLGTKYISMNHWFLWSGYIRAVKRSGYYLYTYTLNDPKRAQKLSRYGLDAIVTDYPDRFQTK